MSASGEKTARILRLPLTQGTRHLAPAQGNGEAAERRVLGARMVAFLAALVFGFAAWLPWLVITYHNGFGQSLQSFSIDGGTLAQALPLLFVGPGVVKNGQAETLIRIGEILRVAWPVVTGAGVLLAPLLWVRSHTRASRLPLAVYGAWLPLAAVFTLGLAKFIFFPPTIARGGPFSVPEWRPGWGLWMAMIALIAGTSAWVTLARYDRSSPRSAARGARSPIRRTRVAWVGIGLLTVGILLWGLGFVAIPWATVNCPITPITINHFVAGRCAALDSGDALMYFAGRTLTRDTWNLAGGIYPLYGVLVGGGLLVLMALWRTSPSRSICAWATLWLLGASAIAYLAYRGVGVILTVNPMMSGDARGIWVGASGVTTTLLGLLLAWMGIIPLERAAALAAPSSAARTADAADAPLHVLTSEDDEFEVTSLR